MDIALRVSSSLCHQDFLSLQYPCKTYILHSQIPGFLSFDNLCTGIVPLMSVSVRVDVFFNVKKM